MALYHICNNLIDRQVLHSACIVVSTELMVLYLYSNTCPNTPKNNNVELDMIDMPIIPELGRRKKVYEFQAQALISKHNTKQYRHNKNEKLNAKLVIQTYFNFMIRELALSSHARTWTAEARGRTV